MGFARQRRLKNTGNERNVQTARLRPGSVQLDFHHKNGKDRTVRTAKPIKLNERLIADFCKSLRACPGGPVEMFCDALGIVRSTFYEWLDRGKSEPDTLYGRFALEVTKAMGDAWRQLHVLAVKAKPEQVLFRRYQTFYPLPKSELDVTSGDLPIGETFNVVLQLHDSAEKQTEEPRFKIE